MCNCKSNFVSPNLFQESRLIERDTIPVSNPIYPLPYVRVKPAPVYVLPTFEEVVKGRTDLGFGYQGPAPIMTSQTTSSLPPLTVLPRLLKPASKPASKPIITKLPTVKAETNKPVITKNTLVSENEKDVVMTSLSKKSDNNLTTPFSFSLEEKTPIWLLVVGALAFIVLLFWAIKSIG